jgi:hypothetical protein
MAYKKYIKRNGKVYGPYTYHSKRVNGKVVTEYHGSKAENKVDKRIYWISGIAFVVLVAIVLSFTVRFTGESIVDFDEMENTLTLNLNSGELVPMDSDIVISSGENIYNYKLHDLVAESPETGDFFLQGSDLTGVGDGYGLVGSFVDFPEVFFELQISFEVDVLDENGSVIETSTDEYVVQGSVSAGADFEESIPEGANVVIILGSVEDASGVLSEDILSMEIVSDTVVVSTSYSVSSEGFGENYVGEDVLSFVFDLNELGVNLSSGDISLSIYYGEVEFVSFDSEISVPGDEGDNVTADEAVENVTSGGDSDTPIVENETEEDVVEINESEVEGEVPLEEEEDNFTRVIVNITEIPLEDYEFVEVNLTISEKQVLVDNFGMVSVFTYVSEYKDKFIVEFEVGSYTMSNAYEKTLSDEELSQIVKRDGSLWLRDLARNFLSSETGSTSRDDLNSINNY